MNKALEFILERITIFLLFLIHIEKFRDFQNIFYFEILVLISFQLLRSRKIQLYSFRNYFIGLTLITLLAPNIISIIYLISMGLFLLWLHSLQSLQIHKNFIIFLILFSCLIPFVDGNSYTGVFGNNITFAGILFFGLYLTLKESRSIFKTLLILWFLFFTIIAKSKTHYVLTILLLFGWFLNPKWILKYKLLIITSIILAPFIYFQLIQYLINNEVLPNINLNGRNIFDLSGRSTVYNIIPDFITNSPLGVGLGLSAEAIKNNPYNLTISSTHNAWIKLTFETSIVLLVGFVISLKNQLNRLQARDVFFILLLMLKFSFEIFTPFGLSLFSLIFFYPLFEADKRT